MCLSFIVNKLSLLNIKLFAFYLFYLICVINLIYHSIHMTFDYLNFDFKYKLLISNEQGFYLPPINLCTGANVMFNRSKVIEYFDINNLWKQYRSDAQKYYEQNEKNLPLHTEYQDYCTNNNYKTKDINTETNWKWGLNFCLNKWFRKYKSFIDKEICFYETMNLIINGNNLFDIFVNINSNDTKNTYKSNKISQNFMKDRKNNSK